MESPFENHLKDFFEKGNLSFLLNDLKYNQVVDVIRKDVELENKVAIKLNEITYKLCKGEKHDGHYLLGLIYEFTSEFSQKNIELAYQKAYHYLDTWIKDLGKEELSPFQGGNSTGYKSEIGLLVDQTKAQYFNNLPDHFQELDKLYSLWCYTFIVLISTTQQKEINTFSKRDIQIFIEASVIASRYHDSKELQSNLNLARKALLENGVSKGLPIIGGIIFVFFIVKLLGGFSTSFNSVSPETSRISEELKEEMYTRMENLNYENNIQILKQREDLLATSTEHSNHSEFLIHPRNSIEKKVSSSVAKIKKSKYSLGSDYALRTQKIPVNNYFVKGQFVRVNVRSGEEAEHSDFTILYDLNDKLYKINYGKNEYCELSLIEIENVKSLRTENTIKRKFSVIINNLNAINNRYPNEKDWHGVDDFFEYSIMENMGMDESAFYLKSTSGILKYDYTTEEKDEAYCTLVSDNTVLKYIFKHQSGVLVKMIRATTTPNKEEVEMVVVERN